MRLSFLAVVGVASVSLLGAAACSSDVEQQEAASATGSSSSSGGAGTSTVASTVSSTHSATVSSSSTGMGGDPGMVSDVYPAKHDAAPQVVKASGPTLKNANFIPIFFAEDDPTMIASLTTFTSTVGASTYWTGATSEYAINAATSGTPITLTEAAPTNIDDSAVQTWLDGKLEGATADPTFPAPVANQTLYVIYYPSATTITEGGQTSCVAFGGYHNDFAMSDGTLVAYAVMPRCDDFDGFVGLDAVTAGASHEMVEGVTDPYPQDKPAYSQTDDDHFPWIIALGGGEIGDMCAFALDSFTNEIDTPYVVQRMWSNKAAKKGADPCVPYPSDDPPYFNSVPHETDKISIMGAMIDGTLVPVGQSKTVEVDMFSDSDTGGPWDVEAADYNSLMGGQPELDFTWDRTSGQNGEKLYLTITVLQASQFDAELYYIFSSLGGRQTVWVGFVGN